MQNSCWVKIRNTVFNLDGLNVVDVTKINHQHLLNFIFRKDQTLSFSFENEEQAVHVLGAFWNSFQSEISFIDLDLVE